MAGPLTPNVRKRLETLRSHDPAHRVGVILTLSPGVSALTFAAPGLDVDHRIPEPPLVMGSATCAVALALALRALKSTRAGCTRCGRASRARARDPPHPRRDPTHARAAATA
jgi:hypothetical protein